MSELVRIKNGKIEFMKKTFYNIKKMFAFPLLTLLTQLQAASSTLLVLFTSHKNDSAFYEECLNEMDGEGQGSGRWALRCALDDGTKYELSAEE